MGRLFLMSKVPMFWIWHGIRNSLLAPPRLMCAEKTFAQGVGVSGFRGLGFLQRLNSPSPDPPPPVRIPGRMPGACVLHAYVPVFSRYRSNPQGRSRYQTSEFPTTSEFPAELPTHTPPQLVCVGWALYTNRPDYSLICTVPIKL